VGDDDASAGAVVGTPERTWRVGPEDFALLCVIGQGERSTILIMLR
jgi:hypothetical protein